MPMLVLLKTTGLHYLLRIICQVLEFGPIAAIPLTQLAL
jgi:hypothetical protein